MRDIIELCIELDTAAIDTYAQLAASCEDPAIGRLFEQMGKEEQSHVGWWNDLLEAWDAGLVPPVADEDELRASLQELARDVREAVPVDCSELSVDEMLADRRASRVLHARPRLRRAHRPRPAEQQVDVRDAYSRHIMRLVDTIEDAAQPHRALALPRSRARPRPARPAAARQARDAGPAHRAVQPSRVLRLPPAVDVVRHALRAPALGARSSTSTGSRRSTTRFGHPAGDEALKTVADALRSAVRTSDIVGRYGGDEFAILAPETDRDELVQLMERVLDGDSRDAGRPCERARGH